MVAERKDACDDCGASHCCASFGSNSEMVIKALNRAGAKEGDLVSITLSSGTVLQGAAVLYLIPLAGLMSAHNRPTPAITRIIKPSPQTPG